MLPEFTQQLAQTIEANAWLAPLAALLAGVLTAANPCVLAMVPLMVAFVAGQERHGLWRSFLLSLTFCLGLTLALMVAYFGLRLATGLIPPRVWTYLAAAVCMLVGLHMAGALSWNLPAMTGVQTQHRGYVGALLLGLLFAIVSTPCAGPVLVAILALSNTGTSTAYGLVVLVAYSLGHCALVLAGGTSMGLVQRLADSRGWQRGIDVLRHLAGAFIFVAGLYVLFFL